jgi:hypothetical protein
MRQALGKRVDSNAFVQLKISSVLMMSSEGETSSSQERYENARSVSGVDRRSRIRIPSTLRVLSPLRCYLVEGPAHRHVSLITLKVICVCSCCYVNAPVAMCILIGFCDVLSGSTYAVSSQHGCWQHKFMQHITHLQIVYMLLNLI